jgi:uracil-DNA glycosylase
MKISHHPFLMAYRSLPYPSETAVLTTMRGSLKAKMLLLAEHPTAEEYEANVPFSGAHARTYCAILAEAGFDSDRDFLVMPFSRFGPKPNKASTQDTLPFLQKHLDSTGIKCVVVIGMNAFGFTFAGGRKTHARSIIGNPMFMPHLGTRAVYVLPDTTLLEDLGNEEEFKLKKRAEDKAHWIHRSTLNLRAFVEKHYRITV